MEQIGPNKSAGLNGNALKTWGMLFLTMGIASKALLQNGILGLGEVSARELLAAMQASQGVMIWATLALVMQAIATCAVPIFALLLVEEFQREGTFRDLFLRIFGIAVISEIPYNLAMGGSLMVTSNRNPVFGLVLGMVILYSYRRYEEKSFQNVLIKVVVTLAAFAWGMILNVQDSFAVVLLVCVLWAFRKNSLYRNFAGAAAVVACTLMSPFYLASPMGFLAIHFYNKEPGEGNQIAGDLAYPVILLLFGVAAKFL